MANENPDPDSNGVQADSPGNNKTANTPAPRNGSDDARKITSLPPTVSSIPPLRSQSANNLARVSSPSPASSPRTSRNASPVRKDSRPAPLAGPISTQPSAAAIQRALSAANAPQLTQGAVVDAVTKLPRPPRSGENTPHWPTSPRLKSPPPSATNSRRESSTGQKKLETPSITVQGATPQNYNPPASKSSNDEQSKSSQLQTPMKGPSRGPSGKSVLETVQEDSAGDVREPSPAALAAATELKPLSKLSDEEVPPPPKREIEGEKHAQQAAESGSESAGTRSPQKRDMSQQSARPKNASMKSYASLSAKSRSGEAKQGMTVETETVPSVPQSALNVGDRSGTGRGDTSGSIKQKGSNEAIRPKKERRKTVQKARSINSTVSSKADIFEQRVANAVDEANSSESDETFVYESNPPEPQRRARHHSRTPSVASSHSVADQQRGGIRSFGEVVDDNRRVAGKRSMKFSNNAQYDPDSPEGKDGSVRSHTPRHFGRFGRGGSQQSMFDPDSPFTQASRLRSNQRSKPGSPRSPGPQQTSGLLSRKQETSYDFDGEVGDDERAPLLGTVRTQRHSRSAAARRLQRSPSIDDYYNDRRRNRCSPCSSWPMFFILLLIVLLISGVFLVMSNRPLYGVELLEITNVLASEQELILDLWVTAINPNAFGITVADMDLDIFAKSKHVGTGGSFSTTAADAPPIWIGSTASRRRRQTLPPQENMLIDSDGWQDLSKYWRPTGGVDKGTDPPTDDRQTMLLGRVFHFDSALSFAASPLQQQAQNATGELRLQKPGNKTETGGSARWERVLQNDFELIVRGSLKYQLPISSRLQSVAIGKSVVVHPEGDVDGKLGGGSRRLSPVDHSEHWQWVDWDEARGD